MTAGQTAGQNVVALITAWHAKDITAYQTTLNCLTEEELRDACAYLIGQLYAAYEVSFWSGMDHDAITALIQKLGSRIA